MPAQMFVAEGPTPVRDPQGFALNSTLADELGLDLGDDWPQVLSGNALPPGSKPITQAYAGHQFGHWNPQLGDGRAVLLGESVTDHGTYDIQLKGAGRTYWSRGGDGRAWLGPVLREFIVSEAMAALGIPTTRALAAVTTGETVLREDGPLPGAILTRVAQSHVRVGTFQYFAAQQDRTALDVLLDYTIARHYREASNGADVLDLAVTAQAQLVADWMGVGFVHGVMNTDNAHVGGLTIDYGPCAFLDEFIPGKVFSSIDHGGRYAFANQPQIAAWNLAQFATALLPLADDRAQVAEAYTKIVHDFAPRFYAAYHMKFAGKFGLALENPESAGIIEDGLKIMADNLLDFTQSFWALSHGELPAAWPKTGEWATKWKANFDAHAVQPSPALIPRNHTVEAMIKAAAMGDKTPFETLWNALKTPFDMPNDRSLIQPPKPEQRVLQTFCGT